MIKLLSNPFIVYPLSFIIVFFLYSLGWSDLYPSLSFTTIIFFVISFILYFIFGYYVQKNKYLGFSNADNNINSIKHLIIIFIGFGVEFIYERDIPLFSVILGYEGVDYRDFGIKSLHVFLVSYNSFITVLLFHKYISHRTKKNAVFFILSLFPALLIMSRGMVLIGLFSAFFVFIQSLKKMPNLKIITLISIITIFVLFAFGWLGNQRSGHGDPNYIPSTSMATKNFMNSNIPREFYWTYLYGASPLGNFQYNINHQENVNYNFFDFFIFEMTPAVISKRVAYVFGREKLKPKLMLDWLTVGTIYSKSYSYVKWLGPIILMLYVLVIMLVIIGLVPKRSNYHVSTIAILSTMVFMNTFSNMIVFSGVILQFFYPIVFAYLENKKIVYLGK